MLPRASCILYATSQPTAWNQVWLSVLPGLNISIKKKNNEWQVIMLIRGIREIKQTNETCS